MHRLVQSYMDELVSAGNENQLSQALAHVTAGLDLNFFAYIVIPSAAGHGLRLITNYAEHWRRHYVAQRYETCDPIILRSIRSPLAFEWGPDFGDDSPFVRKFFDEASCFGVCYGYTVPINHWHGRFAALTFATDGNQASFLQTVRHHALGLKFIAYQFHFHIRGKSEPLSLLGGIRLTYRERQCLALAARSRSFADISAILGISPRTVKFHLDNVRLKLGVSKLRDAFRLLSDDEQ